jgi:2-polyprenyl-6-methoxyphenol hydroxylase-like FAD-dependent oxidoreductase
MASSETTDVLVIGAGPVGLTLACELKRHGVSVRLVEKKAEPLQHPNAAIVHVRTLEILAAMGAVDGFLKEGYAFPGLHVRAFGKRIGFIAVGGIDSPYPAPRTLGQQITERLLNEHLVRLGGRVERQVEAVGVEQNENEVRVRLHHLAENKREEIAAARWVVGCEGSASITRESLAIPFPGERYPGKEFLQADANVRWTYPHGYGYQFMTAEHILVLLPYNKEGHYRIICGRNDKNPEDKSPPALEEMQELVRAIADPAAELYDPVWLNRFRSGHRLAARFRDGRAFLAGDAGHVHIPIGGQGMNYGMHDAFNLGWKLAAVAKGEAHPALLETYETERHAADEALIRGTDTAFHLLVQPHAAKEMVLKLVGPTIMGLPAFQEKIRNTMGEVNVAYPQSALSEDHGGSTGPAAGDRAPDALVVRMPDRRTVSVFEVLHGTRWTLLLFAGTAPSADDVEALERISGSLAGRYGTRVAIHLVLCDDPPVPVHENWAAGVLMDRERYVHVKYGVEATPCLYLIRPDWQIAFRGGLDHGKELSSYLAHILA